VTGGRTGLTLAVELATSEVAWLERSALGREFLGGRGLGVALLAEFGSPAKEALDPSQPFVLAAGPLTGTSAPSSGRFAAVAPSPLTGTIFDSNAGGRFGVRLRSAGLDALLITGAAPEWSVLVIDGRSPAADDAVRREPPSGDLCGPPGGERRGPYEQAVLAKGTGHGGRPRVRLVPAQRLSPMLDPRSPELTSSRTTALLREALGAGFSLVFPSVAGRRGSLLGSLRTDDRRNLGRGGLGACFAAKRLLAVAVAADGPLPAADPERFDFLVYEAAKLLAANPVTSRALPRFGTAVLMHLVNSASALPVRNYTASEWEEVDSVSGETVSEDLVVGRTGCFGCRIRCTPRIAAGDGPAAGERGFREGPEYETLWAFGPACGVANLKAISEANRLCAEYGLDTISTGATIAAAMELSEQGSLARTLRFGDSERMLELVDEMALGRGFGAELADGSARFAARYGRPDLAMHVKGLEMPAYDPRGMVGQGLAYATSNRGACHLRGNMLGPEVLGIPKLVDRREPVGKAGILINLQHLSAVFDSACLCKFAGFAFGEELLARLLESCLGRHLGAQDLLRAGERTWNLERLWNLSAGFTSRDDTLPDRLLGREQVSADPRRSVPLEPMLSEYYRARGWDSEGRPSERKLLALGLSETAALLGRRAADPGDRASLQGWRPEAAAAASAPHRPAPAGAGQAADREGPHPPSSKKGSDRHLRAV
jgi:aldehyde:ferredoxin oxidoreductase